MMKKRLTILAAFVCAFAVFALPVSAADETPASTETSGENWTDPETGYVYKDGVNATVQGDIMLLAEGEELPSDDTVVSPGDGQNETDPETGYVYKDGVNNTTQGDIALYSEDEETAMVEEAAPLDSVPKTGTSGSKTAFLAAAAAGSALLLAKKRGESR